jgi:hypothetical protein
MPGGTIVIESRRPLSSDETGVLREVQDFWGPQNDESAVLIDESGEAYILVLATDGSSPVMVNLTNVGAWLRDGTITIATAREWVQGPVAEAAQARVVTVWMPLLNEGVDVWRPVEAEALPSGWYRINGSNEHKEDEDWAFEAGDVVVCAYRELSDGETLVVVGKRE